MDFLFVFEPSWMTGPIEFVGPKLLYVVVVSSFTYLRCAPKQNPAKYNSPIVGKKTWVKGGIFK
jgi:hypothetical protein